jgi:subtilisin family serine protease
MLLGLVIVATLPFAAPAQAPGSMGPELLSAAAPGGASNPLAGQLLFDPDASHPPSAPVMADEARYIVVLQDSVKHPGAVADAQAEEVEGEVGLVYRHALKGYAATLPRDEVESLEEDPRVKYVALDRKVKTLAQATPTGVQRINGAGNKSLQIDGKDGLRVDADVAVIDTGVDFEHPDLNVVNRTNCVHSFEESEVEQCVDDSGADVYGHGTHVAGTIGALDNGIGVVGVAPGARIWSVKVLEGQGYGTDSWVIAGIDWVTAHANQIEVANMSIGGWGVSAPLNEAIEASSEAGVVYVAAAGNSAADAKDFYPAASPDVITVSALADYDGKAGGKSSPTCTDFGPDDRLATFSNYGTTVEVAAPGVCILSTVPIGGSTAEPDPEVEYALYNGTSMASPHVAGAAAILASKANPEDLEDVEAIRETIVSEGSAGWTDTSPDGVKEPLLDVADEVSFDAHDGVVLTQPATIASASEATLHGEVNAGGLETSYRFEYGTTTSYGTKVPKPDGAAGAGSEYGVVSQGLTGLTGHTIYHYRLVASNAKGTFYGNDQVFATTPPAVTTDAAGAVNANDATLHATVNPEGFETRYRFEYGTTASYGRSSPLPEKDPGSGVVVGSGLEGIEVNRVVGALSAETTYHFRVVATNLAGRSYGEDRTFTTGASEWKAQTSPSPEVEEGTKLDQWLEDVSCSSRNDCMAVGHSEKKPWVANAYSALAQHWDGEEWSEVPTPAEATSFRGVSCVAPDRCVAVGTRRDFNLPALASWDGSAWAYDSAPSGALRGQPFDVSCASASACVAVGTQVLPSEPYGRYRVLAMVWDGTEWTVEIPEEPITEDGSISSLSGVSCASADSCIAVGEYRSSEAPDGTTLVEHWDGEEWSIVDGSGEKFGGSSMSSISCAGADWPAAGCTAINLSHSVQRWDGEEWSPQSFPAPAGVPDFGLSDIDCLSPSECEIAGVSHGEDHRTPMAAAWDGTGWSLQTTVDPSQTAESNGPAGNFLAISCPAPGRCTATGLIVSSNLDHLALAERYAPRAVTEDATAVRGESAILHGTVNPEGAATSYRFEYGSTTSYGSKAPASPQAVGSGDEDVEVSETIEGLAPESTIHFRLTAIDGEEEIHGRDRVLTTGAPPAWSQQPAPKLAGGPPNGEFNSVACPAVDSCLMTGYGSGAGIISASWDGSSWGVEEMPELPAKWGLSIPSLSCLSAASCIAVGNYANKTTSAPESYVEFWDGLEWTPESLPKPTGATYIASNGVSCESASACTIVGAYTYAGSDVRLLAERWDGSKWTPQSVPWPAGATYGELNTVSCRAGECMAAGYYVGSGGVPQPFAERWDGSKWTALSMPAPAKLPTYVQSLACASTECAAVGFSEGESPEPFVVRWNGTAWSTSSVPLPAEAEGGYLAGVSCRPTGVCVAVGSSNVGGGEQPYAVRLSGSEWALETLPAWPEESSGGFYGGVSCSTADACTAVGGYFEGSKYLSLLDRYE